MKFVVAFFFPRLPITKATINFQFPLAIKAEWSSGGSERWDCDPEEPSSIFSLLLFSDR